MTNPRHPNEDRADWSEDRGVASSSPCAWAPASDVWVVNFNNGNVDNNDRDNNKARVRAVRSVGPAGEYPGDAVSMRSLYDAWKAARRHKQPSENQLAFDTSWIDGLIRLQERIRAGTWSPSPATCFVATRPKAREIHAPDFADRVVHHWLVSQLEAVYEPAFIHDSYGNRSGKGTHAAVRRLRDYIRQVDSGQGSGWYLQLDVRNFFYSIHRPTLWRMLKARMARADVPLEAVRVVHALLRRHPGAAGVIHRSTAAERAHVPRHKRLENAAPGCGVPIGNLSSQFFGNVYLDALDQHVKRVLRAKRYVRFVDDFVLVHQDRQQLEAWRGQIERFLRDRLRLELKGEFALRPLRAGVDFLGYVVYPNHVRVRRRVVRHAREVLARWQQDHVRGQVAIATPADLAALRSTWSSYVGHFAHADARGLQDQLQGRFPWLRSLLGRQRRFDYRLEHRRLSFPIGQERSR